MIYCFYFKRDQNFGKTSELVDKNPRKQIKMASHEQPIAKYLLSLRNF